jgi:hypothetical protein
LSDFWDRHARFVAVVQLWEALSEDNEALKQAWRWIHQRFDQINQVEPATFASVRNFRGDRYIKYPGAFPWEKRRAVGFEEELEFLSGPLLRAETFRVLHYELNLHSHDCHQVWQMKSVGVGDVVIFEPTRGFSSLWGAIWDLFGQDISTLRHSWRVCRECSRLFYPKDRRSVCCTTEHQSLWSKRMWARENRKPKFSGHEPTSLLKKGADR